MKTKKAKPRAKSRELRVGRARRAGDPQECKRVENWPVLLARFIEAKRSQPFDWRVNNCAFFACDWLALATDGTDPAAKYRARCTSELAAARLLKAGGGIVALVTKDFARRGWVEVAPAYARRGDIAATATPAGLALGVVVGELVAHAGPAGVAFVPLSACPRAWRIL